MTSVHDHQASLPVMPTSISQTEMVGTLVAQAMDDLEASRIDVEAALALVAKIAWQHGYDQAATF